MKRGERSSIERAMGRTAALQFHRIAVGLVVPATKVEIARIVGENRQNYSGYLSGRSTITLDHVATWIARWEVAGHPPLVLVVTGSAITVDEVRGGVDDDARSTLANECGFGDPPSPGWWFDPGTDAWNRPAPTVAERYTVAATEVRGQWRWWRGIRYGLDDTTTVASTARAGMIAADTDRLAVKP